MTPKSEVESWRDDVVILVVICLVALAVRVSRIALWTSVIENEGPHYVRLAVNLLHGRGFVGITEVPELSFAPMYPLLIASVLPIVKNPDLAGRIVSTLGGVVLVVSMYTLVRQVYGRSAALVGATLAALHPLLVGYSTAVYNEIPYLALTTAGAAGALRCLKGETLKSAGLAGGLFGLAYLTRPEAIGFPLIAASAILLVALARRDGLGRAVRAAACLLVIFGIVAAPYVVYLSSFTGGISFQTKGKLNYTIGRRFNEGMPYDRASSGIRDDLTVEGPFLEPVRFSTSTPYPWDARELVKYFWTTSKRNRAGIEAILTGPSFGVLLLGLAMLGMFSEPWHGWLRVANLYLVTNLLFISTVVLQVHLVQFRYLLPFYPAAFVWASRGAVLLFEWTNHSIRSTAMARATGRLFQGVVVTMLLLSSLRGLLWSGEIQQGGAESLGVKLAGEWIAQRFPPGKTMMTAGDSRVPYYANGVLMLFPYAESPVALRYIERQQPSFIVLSTAESQKRPYLRDWLEHGVPDSRARIVYDMGGRSNEPRVAVYQWDLAPRAATR